MATEGSNITVTFQAAEDMSTLQYQAVAIADKKVANDGKEATGILNSKPASGEHGTLIIFGKCKGRAGGTLAVGGRFTVSTSGYLTAAASGDHHAGLALEAITSGSVGSVLWQGAGYYQVSSL